MQPVYSYRETWLIRLGRKIATCKLAIILRTPIEYVHTRIDNINFVYDKNIMTATHTTYPVSHTICSVVV